MPVGIDQMLREKMMLGGRGALRIGGIGIEIGLGLQIHGLGVLGRDWTGRVKR